MRGFNPVVNIFQKNSGASVLRQCRVSQFRAPTLHSSSTVPKQRPAGIFQHKSVLAAATVTIGIGFLIGLSDDLKHGYAAAQRSGRVLLTLAMCINE